MVLFKIKYMKTVLIIFLMAVIGFVASMQQIIDGRRASSL